MVRKADHLRREGTRNPIKVSPLTSLVIPGRSDAERMSDPLQNPNFIRRWTEENAPRCTKKAMAAMTSVERTAWEAELVRRDTLLRRTTAAAEPALDLDDQNRRAAWRQARRFDKRSARSADAT